MGQETPVVFVVDDDATCAKVTRHLLEHAGYTTRWFDAGSAFLQALTGQERGCVLLDLMMPGINGLELQEQLNARGLNLPVVFLSGFGTVPQCTLAMKNGACDFLQKPVAREVLVAAVEQALARGKTQESLARQREAWSSRYASLSPREKDVLLLLVRGLSNRAAGEQLHISEKTVKVHRARVRAKMQVASLPELVLAAQALGLV